MSTSGDTWRQEKLGWRDERISERHGHWGFNCPAVDLDFVVVEYNYGKACALVEYKHMRAADPNVNHASYRALVDLADGRGLPCLIALYNPETWAFRVIPLNEPAMALYKDAAGKWMTEQSFVRSLHVLRRRTLSAADNEAIEALGKD